MSTASYWFSWPNMCTEFWDKRRLSLSQNSVQKKTIWHDFLKIFLQCWICPEHAVGGGTMQRNAKWARPPTDSPDQIFVLNFETNDVCLCQMTPFRIFWPTTHSAQCATPSVSWLIPTESDPVANTLRFTNARKNECSSLVKLS